MASENLEIEDLKQVVFSLQCEIKNLKDDLEIANNNRFYDGVISCLAVLNLYDSHVLAVEIAKAAFGKDYLKKAKECALRSGNKCDADTIKWLAAKQDAQNNDFCKYCETSNNDHLPNCKG